MPILTDREKVAAAYANAAEAGVDLLEPRTVTLIGDACWQTPPEGPGKPFGHANGYAGKTYTMTAGAAIRLVALGAIAGDELDVVDALPAGTSDEELEDLDALEPDQAGGLAAFVPTGPDPDIDPDGTDIDTAELIALSAPELVAHVGQFAGDAARVLEAELARGAKARLTVLRVCGHDPDVES